MELLLLKVNPKYVNSLICSIVSSHNFQQLFLILQSLFLNDYFYFLHFHAQFFFLRYLHKLISTLSPCLFSTHFIYLYLSNTLQTIRCSVDIPVFIFSSCRSFWFPLHSLFLYTLSLILLSMDSTLKLISFILFMNTLIASPLSLTVFVFLICFYVFNVVFLLV